MNVLKDRLVRLIRAQGPISVAQYMQVALTDPELGYYMKGDPLGRDFITAPEVSQIFGELIGLFFVQAWEDRGQPDKFHLLELGPGRGTLMSDFLRAARLRPRFMEAARITLIEASQHFRAIQEKNLSTYPVEWRSHLGQLPDDAPLFVVANEFFDALPVHQFVRLNGRWHERMVSVESNGLLFTATPEPVPDGIIPDSLCNAAEGAIFETSPTSHAVAHEIAIRIRHQGGVALIIDYGHTEAAIGNTLQAVKDHSYVDVLLDPGNSDITTHVDFASLAKTAREAGAGTQGPVTQSAFLESLGIHYRAEQLKRGAPQDARSIDAAIDRLVGEGQMGTLFKVMAIAQRGSPPLPGFPC